MIDLHCHILPGMDDGAVSMDESLAMCRQAAQDGIHTIVATPHTLDGVYVNPIFKVMEQVSVLNKALSEHDMRIRILPGSDVHLCGDLWRYVESGEAGTINNDKKYLLLELPVQFIPPGVKDEIFNLKVRGMTPIITHPERNLVIQKDSSVLYEAIGLGALSQMTASSITGWFGGAVKKCAETLLKRRMVHIIASDAHSSDRRPPLLSQSVEAASQILGNADEAEQMVVDAPERVVSGQALEVPEPLKEKRFRLGFW
jgi:protein-tyrosine phosphatase